MRKLPIYIFVLSSLVEIGSPIFNWELSLFAKPIIILSLLAYYYLNSTTRSAIFILALFFCWGGDVFLIFQSSSESFFIAGLGSFLIGHILYVLSYSRFRSIDKSKELVGPQKVRFSLPIILAGTGLVTVLYPKLGALRTPVMLYALVITIMVLTALFRYGRTTKTSFILIFSGALFFMISDSMLAINKFLNPLPWSGVLIMTTYCMAQFLIVTGAPRTAIPEGIYA